MPRTRFVVPLMHSNPCVLGTHTTGEEASSRCELYSRLIRLVSFTILSTVHADGILGIWTGTASD